MQPRLASLLLSGLSFARVSQALYIAFSDSSKDQVSNDSYNFQNINNVSSMNSIYTAELTVNGNPFTVMLDSGSSDLWLDTSGIDLSSFTNTSIDSNIKYVDYTSASGSVLIANATLGSFTTSQAFISAPDTNATVYNDKGLLGVGPPLLSQVNRALNGSQYNGKSFLENVFDANSSLPQMMSFALSRSESTGITSGGIFTIGEIPSNLSAVSKTAKLDVFTPLDRWTVFMDAVVVNGKNYSGHSAFTSYHLAGQARSQTLANLDTGTGFALVPKYYADAIYASVPGANFDETSGAYIVPCDTKLNVSFVFAGVEYPVHPIDTVQAVLGENGTIICHAGFLAADPNPKDGDSQDFTLGGSFLRNVYTVFNFGGFISGNNTPDIQLLSLTDPAMALAEFDSLSAQRNQSLSNTTTSSNSSSSSGDSIDSAAMTNVDQFSIHLPMLALGLVFGTFLM